MFIRVAAAAIVLIASTLPADAQDGLVYRNSQGTSLGNSADGTPQFREDSGWSSSGYTNPKYAVEYGTSHSPLPWAVVFQSHRANTNLNVKSNQLVLDLNGYTYDVKPYLSGSVVKGGKVTVADSFGTGAFLRVKNGTFDNNLTTNSRTTIGSDGAAGRLFIENAQFKTNTTAVGGATNSTGYLTLEDGGAFSATHEFSTGYWGNGTVQLNGAGSTLTAGRLLIGGQGNTGTVTTNHADASIRVTKLGSTSGELLIDNAAPSVPGQNMGLVVNAGRVDIEGNLRLTTNRPNRQGAVEINGGAVNVAGNVQFGYSSADTTGGKIFLNGGRLETVSPVTFAPALQKQFYWNEGTLTFTGATTTISDAQLRTYTQQGAISYQGSRAAGTLAAGQTLEASGALALTGDSIGLAGGTVRAGEGLTLDASLTGYGVLDAVVSGDGSITNTTSNTISIGALDGGNTISSSGDLLVGSSNVDATFTGSSTGTGAFVKQGTGTQGIAGEVANSGGVRVEGGTLLFDNALLNTTDLAVSAGGTTVLSNGASGRVSSLTVDAAESGFVSGGLRVSGGQTNLTVAGSVQNEGWIELVDGSMTVTGTLVNDGIVTNNGVLDAVINGTGIVNGSGVFSGPVTLEAGAMLAPGNSPGTAVFSELTLGEDGFFEFEIADAIGVEGIDWDLAVVTDALAVTATAANPYTILLKSLNSSFDVAALSNFAPDQSYSWRFLAATISDPNSIDLAAFRLDVSSFAGVNSIGPNEFNIVAKSDGFHITYGAQPVSAPESGSLILTSLLGGLYGGNRLLRIRRRRLEAILAA